MDGCDLGESRVCLFLTLLTEGYAVTGRPYGESLCVFDLSRGETDKVKLKYGVGCWVLNFSCEEDGVSVT